MPRFGADSRILLPLISALCLVPWSGVLGFDGSGLLGFFGRGHGTIRFLGNRLLLRLDRPVAADAGALGLRDRAIATDDEK